MRPGEAPVRMDETPLFHSWEQIGSADNGMAGLVMHKPHIEPIGDET